MLELGQVVATQGILNAVPGGIIQTALHRHAHGDWGDVSKDDWIQNDNALANGERIISSYRAPDGTKFWIITERDRSYTTALLPEEY